MCCWRVEAGLLSKWDGECLSSERHIGNSMRARAGALGGGSLLDPVFAPQCTAAVAFASSALGRRMMNGRGTRSRVINPRTQKALTKPKTLDCRSTCAEIWASARWEASVALIPVALKL